MQQSSSTAGPRGQTDLACGPRTKPQSIAYRAAHIGDSVDIARLIGLSGGGLYEYLFDGIMPFLTASELLAAGVAADSQAISYHNCFLAVDQDRNRVVGLMNLFPADELKQAGNWLLPQDRWEHILPIIQMQDWGSMFLNALAVDECCRSSGIGTHLLHWAKMRAQQEGFPRLSLHVWADNAAARALYRKHGFAELGVATIPSVPGLQHEGGSVLMTSVLAP